MIFSRYFAFISLALLSLASADVICGAHSAARCERCPYRPDGTFVGRGWCNGECEWNDDNNECASKALRNWNATLLLSSARAAEDFCADPNPDSSAEKYHMAAHNLHDILKAYEVLLAEGSPNPPGVEAAVSEAATIALDILTPNNNGGETCSTRATGCNKGMILLHQLRNLVGLRGVDPFPDSARHGALFEEHGVLIADGLFLNAGSMEVVHSYFDAVPAHLMIEGMRKDAPYITMSIKDEFKCNGAAEEIEPGVTKRGFNVFRNQLGDSREDAFQETSFPFIGDLLMTVTRHEAAHQFDRFVQEDDDLWAMMQAYITQATTDLDWLRNSVTNEYFQRSPQEILAAQIGNQYQLSSSNQLALALDRLSTETSSLPLAWFLLHVDIFSRSPTECTDRTCRTHSVLYHSGVDVGGITCTYHAEVGRDLTTGRIISLGLPGCPVLGVTWSNVDGAGALPMTVEPKDWSCEHSLEAGDAVCDATPPTTYSYKLRLEKTECTKQSNNYGEFLSPALCATVAGEDGCDSFMFSTSYTSWGCRCCSEPDPGFLGHDLWAVYDVVDCEEPDSECEHTDAPTLLPTADPTDAPTALPTADPTDAPSMSPIKAPTSNSECVDTAFMYGGKKTCAELLGGKPDKKIRQLCKKWDKYGRLVKNHCPKTCKYKCNKRCADDDNFFIEHENTEYKCDDIPNSVITCTTLRKKQLVAEHCRKSCGICS